MDTTYTLTVTEFERTKVKFEKLLARAVKKGFTGGLSLTGTRIIRANGNFYPNMAQSTMITVVEAVITGEPACYEGYEFLAKVEALPGADGVTNWVVSTAPGVEANVDRSVLVDGYCDHCKVTRPNRRKLYLVREVATGQIIQVGSTCIKDFLGWSAMPVWISEEQVRDSIGFERTPDFFPTAHLVALSLAIASVSGGFVPKSCFDKVPTADAVITYLCGRGKEADNLRHAISPLVDQFEKQAGPIMESVAENLRASGGEFAANMLAVLDAEAISMRQLGLAAAVVSVHEKMLGAQYKKQAKAVIVTQWLGQVGEKKVPLTGVVTRIREFDGYAYNSVKRMVEVTGGPHVAVTFTEAMWAWDIEEGQQVAITGTVKKHDEFNGTKQTEMIRVKLVPVVEEKDASKGQSAVSSTPIPPAVRIGTK